MNLVLPKRPLLLFAVFLGSLMTSSEQNITKGTFVRIFNNRNQKINKGLLVSMSDTSVTVQRGSKTIEVPVSEIGSIKLRRSPGHTIFVTAVTVAIAFGILGAATADPDAWVLGYTAAEGAASGLLGGGLVGGALGAIIAFSRTRPIFHVNNDPAEWMKVKELLNPYLPRQRS